MYIRRVNDTDPRKGTLGILYIVFDGNKFDELFAELGTVLQFVLYGKGYRLAGAYEKGDKVPVQVLEGCTIDLDEIFSE